jgi:transmembrane sensor
MNGIDAEAADWAARSDGATLSPEDQARLDAWLGRDLRHVGAYARACALLAAYEDLHDASAIRSPPRSTQPDRRRLLWGGGLAAAGIAGVGLGVGLLVAPETAYATGRGEIRTIDLGHRAVMTLDALSRVTVRHPLGRPVEVGLVEGAISLESGALAVLSCEGVTLRAIDALALLKTSAGGATLVVSRGQVSASQPTGAVVIGASQRARLRTGRVEAPVRIADTEIARTMAWRSGMIALEGATLEDAVAAFARYSATPILLADDATRRRRVTGLFDARDPVGFARSVTVTSGLDLTETAQGIRLSSPAG